MNEMDVQCIEAGKGYRGLVLRHLIQSCLLRSPVILFTPEVQHRTHKSNTNAIGLIPLCTLEVSGNSCVLQFHSQ